MKIVSTNCILLVISSVLLLSIVQCKKDCIESSKCNLDPNPGLCLAVIPRYYYDKDEKKCKEFTWGGCGGVVPFETLEECKLKCECD